MNMNDALMIAETISDNRPHGREDYAKIKWEDLVCDMDTTMERIVKDYNSAVFIKKCYNLV